MGTNQSAPKEENEDLFSNFYEAPTPLKQRSNSISVPSPSRLHQTPQRQDSALTSANTTTPAQDELYWQMLDPRSPSCFIKRTPLREETTKPAATTPVAIVTTSPSSSNIVASPVSSSQVECTLPLPEIVVEASARKLLVIAPQQQTLPVAAVAVVPPVAESVPLQLQATEAPLKVLQSKSQSNILQSPAAKSSKTTSNRPLSLSSINGPKKIVESEGKENSTGFQSLVSSTIAPKVSVSTPSKVRTISTAAGTRRKEFAHTKAISMR